MHEPRARPVHVDRPRLVDGAFAACLAIFFCSENIAVTPGKVVHETPMYQLIQYSPTTETVLDVPLVGSDPGYLDFRPAKSHTRLCAKLLLFLFLP